MTSYRYVFSMACFGLIWAASSQVILAQGPFGRLGGRFGPTPGLRPFPGVFPGPGSLPVRPIPPAANLGARLPAPPVLAVRPPMGLLVPGRGRGRAPAVVRVPNTQAPRSLLTGPLFGARSSASETRSTQSLTAEQRLATQRQPGDLKVYQAGASSYATARPQVPSVPGALGSPGRTSTSIPSVPGTSSILEPESLPLPPPVD